MNNLIIGIDSGSKGGISGICKGRLKPRLYSITNGTESVNAIKDLKSIAQACNLETVAFLEELTGIQKGRRPLTARQAFVMGMNYGIPIGALSALDIEYRTVAPLFWQKSHLDCKDEDYNKHKRLLCDKAKSYYPITNRRITLANCDSLLIARYGEGVINNET